MTHWHPLPRL